MRKSEVYSWRVSPEIKAGLEEVARRSRRSIAEVLDQAVLAWLGRRRPARDDEDQRRLQSRAGRFVGAIAGADPERAEKVRLRIRARLERPRRAG